MWTDGFIAFDTETTGVDGQARIVEIAVVVFEGGRPIREWAQTLFPVGVDWGSTKVREALTVNKLTVAELQGKPTFEQVLPDLMLELSNDVLVAHNLAFDLRMVNQELGRLGRPKLTPKTSACTMSLAAMLDPAARSNKLGDVSARYGVTPKGAHRAAADAEACGLILAAMLQKGQLPGDDASLGALSQRAEAAWRSRPRSPR
jgi:DNA polymerase III epsilon subunit-like protein